MEAHPASGGFLTTRWTLVIRSRGASSEARAALADLCEAYWTPVFAHLRRLEGNEDRARDLTQAFFARVLSGPGLSGAAPERGRFRAFLLAAVNHFLADARDRDRALKRGGGMTPESLEALESVGDDVAGPAVPDARRFDRDWAVSLVNRAVASLAREHSTQDKVGTWQVLKPWLVGGDVVGSQRDAAQQLGWTENAVRVAVHRLRRRFRELVRAEIAQTVDGEEAVREEMRYLLDVLSMEAGGPGPD